MTMEKTPAALRKHVAIVGRTNAGKSTVFNALCGQENAIVSPKPGTTTDPVHKAMELIPFGPIVLTDTAGFGDDSSLGAARLQKTRQAIRRADAAIYVADAGQFALEDYEAFRKRKMPHLLAFTKCASSPVGSLAVLESAYPEALFLKDPEDIEGLRQRLTMLLQESQPEEPALLGDLVPPGGHVLLVTPIDTEAPKGRMILPQMQALRDCLDHGILATVCREFELEQALRVLGSVELVVTDSQAFAYVAQRVPEEIPLTSFSMLLARQKADFPELLAGARSIERLRDGDRILMLEGCTHNHTHEDIGRVKLPMILQKKTGKSLDFAYCTGYDFPEDLSGFRLAIQCGGCMINRGEITARQQELEDAGIPLTNYGIALAWGAGILTRASAAFLEEGDE